MPSPASVKENLKIGGISLDEEMEERLESVLELFPKLAERLGQRAGKLSGVEQKMLAVGRAMVANPSLIMLDEPSAALSPKIMGQLFARSRRLTARE